MTDYPLISRELVHEIASLLQRNGENPTPERVLDFFVRDVERYLSEWHTEQHELELDLDALANEAILID